MQRLQTRICRICGEERPLKISFYKKERGVNGYDTRCKECHCSLSRDRLRKKYNPVKEREKSIARRISGKSIETAKRMVAKFPEKYKARNDFRNAVYAGKIKKLPCKVCGDLKSEGHHEDYSKPFEVIWLCRKHHREIHRKNLSHLTQE